MNLVYPAIYSATGLIDSPHRLMLTASLAIGTLSTVIVPVAEVSPETMPLEAAPPVPNPDAEGGQIMTSE